MVPPPAKQPLFLRDCGGYGHLFQVDGAKGSFQSECSNYLEQMSMFLVPSQLQT